MREELHCPGPWEQVMALTLSKMKYNLGGWVAQLVGASSRTPRGYWFDPWLECVWEATHQCFSLISMFPSTPSSLKSINISSGEDLKKKKISTPGCV